MPRISVPDLLDELDDDDFMPFEKFEPIRRDMAPVSGKHDFQRRSECGVNRHRKQKHEDWN